MGACRCSIFLVAAAHRYSCPEVFMLVFETILVMLAAAVLLLGVAWRWRLPYPVLLALTGAAVAIAPIGVSLHLDPTLVLTLFVAPVLLDAAYDTSLRDLKRQLGPVTRLALI